MSDVGVCDPITRRPIAVGFLTEGTYPYLGGGVSTWSDLLIRGLADFEFHLVAATAQRFAHLRYRLPANVVQLSQIPLWGAGAIDSVRPTVSASEIAAQRRKTTEPVIETQFVPAFRACLQCLFNAEQTFSGEACGEVFVRMARFLRRYDYDATMRSRAVWRTFVDAVACDYRPTPASSAAQPQYTLEDLTTSLGWLASLLRPLSVSPPEVHLFHATVAASVALIGVVAKREMGIPLLLTEHGVYLRERAIGVGAHEEYSFFQKHFLIRMADVTTRLCYHHADLIAPVCQFNGEWERRLGADPARIHVIYNAIDTERFRPAGHNRRADAAPTVVVMANVVPIKDIVTLIRAAAIVRTEIPDLRVWVYGSLTADADYAALCRRLIAELGLQNTVELRGRHAHPEQVYPQCDLVVLPSISEAFPFTVLEAMACGRPVAATNVGGVSEALGDAGVIVPPRSPQDLARAMSELLRNPVRSQQLGAAGRARVLAQFRIQHLLSAYQDAYTRFAGASANLANRERIGGANRPQTR